MKSEVTTIFIQSSKKEDRIIFIAKNILYKANPKEEDFERVLAEIKYGNLEMFRTNSAFYGIPLNYIKKVELEENTNYIEVFFSSDSTEHFRVLDRRKRHEIFTFLRNQLGGKFEFEQFPKWKLGLKPLIAMAVVAGLYIWTMISATIIESGHNNLSHSARQVGVGRLLDDIAHLGAVKLTLLFAGFFGIALVAFLVKIRKPKVVERIVVRD